ncbi:MAG TPA: DEAD/DEAH box helicase [Chthoniobacterales bacterium]|nr:DEAD/DEAH box helicase [Chthoniobacterales bacterium]
MSEIQITERFLMDTGGWQAMKHAKALVQMGRVVSFNYSPPILRGLVREGDTEFRAGLKIRSYTDVENLCSCRDSRDWGTICAHSLALGVAFIRPKAPAPAPVTAPVQPALPILITDAVATSDERDPLRSDDQPHRAPGPSRLELHVVLPPNIETAWQRGQIVVGFEVARQGNRTLASALDQNRTYYCSKSDRDALELGRTFGDGKLPGMTILDRERLLQLVGALVGHPRVTVARKLPVEIAADPIRPSLVTEISAEGGWTIRTDPKSLPGAVLVGLNSVWLFTGAQFRPVSPGLPIAYLPVFREPIRLSAEQGVNFIQQELPTLKSYFQIDGQLHSEAIIEPGIPEVFATFEGSLNHLGVKIQCLYGKRIVTLGVTAPSETFVYNQGQTRSTRNLVFEGQALRRIRDAGFTGPTVTGEYFLRGQNAILGFFAKDLAHLKKDWKVSVGSRFERVTSEIDRITPKLGIIGSGENWFDLSYTIESADGQRFSGADIQRLLQVGQNFTRLKSGRLAIIDTDGLEEFEGILRDCDPSQSRPGCYRIQRSQAAYVDAAFEELPGASIESTREWRNWTQAQRQIVPPEPEPLGDLETILRPYQKEGVFWMRFLSKNGLGGILADEMGLGKTLQTLAFIRPLTGPSLVVCPSSLLFNWAREATRFVPELKVLRIDGPARGSLFLRIPESNLVLTSYPVLRRDIGKFRSFDFASVILDEATHIKNPDTQNSQAAIALRGRHRFVLTGTPVENSVRDLWSILHFVLPGYLGSREDFRERYELPISRGSEPEKARLAKRLRPVMLRRLKRQVVSELPEKIEQLTFCDLSPAQEELYGKLLAESRRKVEELTTSKDQGRARIALFTALLRLRQVCCDIRLVGEDGEGTSGKLEVLEELLEEAIDGGHRVLLFSQFVSMLKLIRARLDETGTRYGYLDGETKDREKAVDAFQQSDELPLFLISLKAGGVGLNLSAADTAIHFDPWWNPAVESQATDRAHRIGQTRVVTAYKLIARGTVEEKILNLQQKKKEMIASTVESEEPMMSGLSIAEFTELLRD